MMVSLLERIQKPSARQNLQRRIDQLVGSSSYPSEMEFELKWIDPFPDTEDADPIDSSGVAAAITEAFRRVRP